MTSNEHAANRDTVLTNVVCPRCDGPLVFARHAPSMQRDFRVRDARNVSCVNPDCHGPTRVTVAEVFKAPTVGGQA